MLLFLFISSTVAVADDLSTPRGDRSLASVIDQLPTESVWQRPPALDWLLDSRPFRAGVYRGESEGSVVLSNGLVRREILVGPTTCTIALDDLEADRSLLRGVKPEATVTINGQALTIGGASGQPNFAYLSPAWVERLKDTSDFGLTGVWTGRPRARLDWRRARRAAPNSQWPPSGVYLRLDFQLKPDRSARVWPAGDTDSDSSSSATSPPALRVSVHYELYDGIPCLSKWITIENVTSKSLRIDRFRCEVLAAVESASVVESHPDVPLPRPDLHVETDYAFGGMWTRDTSRLVVHWDPDPDYATQVNYLRRTPCLLSVGPELGPGQVLEPGDTFESCRAFLLTTSASDRERFGLAQRRMYRTIAPWVTENPLMMHVRHADEKSVRNAIDQCVEVGFEMVILTFGSGFNLERDSEEYRDQMKRLADYAHEKGIELGGYSLLASRHISAEDDVVLPEGQKPIFGNSPCLSSAWGEKYFSNLYRFYGDTGFDLLEHDGSYPGDACLSTSHPGHRGAEDSRWNQWRTITDFYKWCRAKGVYLNVPDFYYLAGSNKCAMGYRETNWSLPRAQQVIHTRQNIFDGTWSKTPSMGWMFVPLTQYHGGGAAATIEPLDEHLDHYERIVQSNLALGAQACYRGPRLYDTPRTRAMLIRWVTWYKKYRDVLESDLIHGRRADGRDVDWMLHVNPTGQHRGLLAVFNPLDQPVQRTVQVPLYYTGLTQRARVRDDSGKETVRELDRREQLRLDVQIPAQGFRWYVFESAE